MKCLFFILALVLLFGTSTDYLRAEQKGPAAPIGLLPPIPPTSVEPKAASEPRPSNLTNADFGLLDLDDPSTLLEMEEQVTPPPPKTVAQQETKQPPLADVPKLALKNPLLPPLPLLASKPENTPFLLEKKGPTPLLPAPPTPPLMAAMNPPVAKLPEESREVSSQPVGSESPKFSLGPNLAGVGLPLIAPSQEKGTPAEVTKKLPVPKTTVLAPLPGVTDVAVILANNQFYPSRIRLKEGVETRLIFTTINKKPAALVIERLQIQRWIAKEKEPTPVNELERSKWEMNREVSSTKVTEIVLTPKSGTYAFHDAISGAAGEINVE